MNCHHGHSTSRQCWKPKQMSWIEFLQSFGLAGLISLFFLYASGLNPIRLNNWHEPKLVFLSIMVLRLIFGTTEKSKIIEGYASSNSFADRLLYFFLKKCDEVGLPMPELFARFLWLICAVLWGVVSLVGVGQYLWQHL